MIRTHISQGQKSITKQFDHLRQNSVSCIIHDRLNNESHRSDTSAAVTLLAQEVIPMPTQEILPIFADNAQWSLVTQEFKRLQCEISKSAITSQERFKLRNQIDKAMSRTSAANQLAELHQVSLELALAKGLNGNATPSASENGGGA